MVQLGGFILLKSMSRDSVQWGQEPRKPRMKVQKDCLEVEEAKDSATTRLGAVSGRSLAEAEEGSAEELW
ncbi:hypothetical protein NDU88_004675 [Pleurodeles waltl]|uniref:Uncharacterized protein n=1 Tax=Pleurodeles waltl TaxID=8319 RepID=A0AAV7PD70_PLEWA|nr:hypothetical protein NDU88_004675 [Pleurodeles waltl]